MMYGNRWKDILIHVNEEQCRCEEVFRSQRCQNYRNRHSHGHQFAPNDVGMAGRVRTGGFESKFPRSIDALHKIFIQKLTSISLLQCHTAIKWNQELLRQAQTCGVREIISNRTCLACLSRTPVHVVPCGHSICDICVLDLCKCLQGDNTLLLLKCCPFGCRWSFGRSFQIRRKPAEAGVRILSLDGYVSDYYIISLLIKPFA